MNDFLKEEIEIKEEYMDTIEKGLPISQFTIFCFTFSLLLLVIAKNYNTLKKLVDLIKHFMFGG